ncbi:peptidylprolyl isomerase [Nitrosophilus alvini]|uniref:peptidylprolyl isomerase n=1 Tax=Nitrosophilus alvini TaxID=2714855 RepID=UPI00190DCEDE|nr:peptidylprolyl isomerase [Nitrosophilus alvini]
MKKFLAALLFTLSSLFAGLVDGIAIVVNNEPITMYEIVKTSKILGVNKEKAVDILIQKKLEDAEVKKLGLKVDDFELEKELEKFAAQNSLTLSQLKNIIKQKGLDLEEYKEEFKKRLLKKKLYSKIASAKVSRPEEEEIKRYYDSHIEEFSAPKYVEVVKYMSTSKKALENLVKNPLASIPDVQKEEEKVDLSTVGSQLAFLLTETKEGSFTPIIPVGKDYIVLFVKKKIDNQPISFEKVKNMVIAKIMEAKKEKAVKEYFEKLRASANIKVYRLP